MYNYNTKKNDLFLKVSPSKPRNLKVNQTLRLGVQGFSNKVQIIVAQLRLLY